jgi:mannose-6-phosphate isomerase-like protein (cupin superfamily)
MLSMNGVLASLFLLVGFLMTSAGTALQREKLHAKSFGMAGASPSISMADSSGTGKQNASSASSVIYINNQKVVIAFAKGETLFDGIGENKNYRASASRHDKPGSAEIHTLDTDIDYVLEGTATYVAGGMIVDSKTVAPNEIRGTAITGGETYRLSKGDMIIVPNGVPHWFKEVGAPFLYFQVKVR